MKVVLTPIKHSRFYHDKFPRSRDVQTVFWCHHHFML
jgi:hypothetical protein